MVPPSLHRAINKNQPGRAKAFHHTRNPSQSVLCSASNGIGSIGTERAPDFAQKLINTVRDLDGGGKNVGAISRSFFTKHESALLSLLRSDAVVFVDSGTLLRFFSP